MSLTNIYFNGLRNDTEKFKIPIMQPKQIINRLFNDTTAQNKTLTTDTLFPENKLTSPLTS